MEQRLMMRRIDEFLTASVQQQSEWWSRDGFSRTFQIRLKIDGTLTDIKIVFNCNGAYTACIILVGESKLQCHRIEDYLIRPIFKKYNEGIATPPVNIAGETILGEFDFSISSKNSIYTMSKTLGDARMEFTPISSGWLVSCVERWNKVLQSDERYGYQAPNFPNIIITAIQDSSIFQDNMKTVYRKQIVYTKYSYMNITLDVAEVYQNPISGINKTIVRYKIVKGDHIEEEILNYGNNNGMN
jgi:hypothetical protein